MEQLSLSDTSPEYEAFVNKFKPKKTTDDCYTPPEVYEAVKQWACRTYGIAENSIVRPFWPGADYERTEYPDGCTVLDNPPFSILTKICAFYLERKIPFFLFAPSLTAFSGRDILMKCCHLICDCNIVYENGARVRTSFVTSYGGDIVAQSCPELTRIVNDVQKRIQKERNTELPKYIYPDHILTAAMLQKYAKRGVEFAVRRSDCVPYASIDAQKALKKTIYGGGLLLSDFAAAERAAAERAAAEGAAALRFELSKREKEIVAMLNQTGRNENA